MDTQALIAAAAAYTERFINAAVPVAKQAYEIGLLTIRIDAVSVLIPTALSFILVSALLKRGYTWVKAAIVADTVEECHVGISLIGGVPMAGLWCFLTWKLLNVWLWVQLFAPDLWLAHEAILKVMTVAGGK